MTEAARLADLIQSGLPHLRSGSLRFWGQSFGRPGDNCHVIIGASSDGEMLEVRFDEGEFLRVFDPSEAVIGTAKFMIGSASKVRWEWNYDHPRRKRNFMQYVRQGDVVIATTDVNPWNPVLRLPVTDPAVKIV